MKESLKKYFDLIDERPELFKDGDLHIVTEVDVIEEFEKKTGKTIGINYESPYRLVVVDLVYTTPGKYFAYERVLPKVAKGAVVTVPMINGKYLLLRSFRHAMREEQYAFPRGFAEPGISPEENAKKELGEEMGACIESVTYLGEVIADSGLSGDRVSVYLCKVENYETQIGHEGIAGSVELTPEELKQWIMDGKINDGFTLSALGLMR